MKNTNKYHLFYTNNIVSKFIYQQRGGGAKPTAAPAQTPEQKALNAETTKAIGKIDNLKKTDAAWQKYFVQGHAKREGWFKLAKNRFKLSLKRKWKALKNLKLTQRTQKLKEFADERIKQMDKRVKERSKKTAKDINEYMDKQKGGFKTNKLPSALKAYFKKKGIKADSPFGKFLEQQAIELADSGISKVKDQLWKDTTAINYRKNLPHSINPDCKTINTFMTEIQRSLDTRMGKRTKIIENHFKAGTGEFWTKQLPDELLGYFTAMEITDVAQKNALTEFAKKLVNTALKDPKGIKYNLSLDDSAIDRDSKGVLKKINVECNTYKEFIDDVRTGLEEQRMRQLTMPEDLRTNKDGSQTISFYRQESQTDTKGDKAVEKDNKRLNGLVAKIKKAVEKSEGKFVISLAGYASVDGSVTRNNKLKIDRAKAMGKTIISALKQIDDGKWWKEHGKKIEIKIDEKKSKILKPGHDKTDGIELAETVDDKTWKSLDKKYGGNPKRYFIEVIKKITGKKVNMSSLIRAYREYTKIYSQKGRAEAWNWIRKQKTFGVNNLQRVAVIYYVSKYIGGGRRVDISFKTPVEAAPEVAPKTPAEALKALPARITDQLKDKYNIKVKSGVPLTIDIERKDKKGFMRVQLKKAEGEKINLKILNEDNLKLINKNLPVNAQIYSKITNQISTLFGKPEEVPEEPEKVETAEAREARESAEFSKKWSAPIMKFHQSLVKRLTPISQKDKITYQILSIHSDRAIKVTLDIKNRKASFTTLNNQPIGTYNKDQFDSYKWIFRDFQFDKEYKRCDIKDKKLIKKNEEKLKNNMKELKERFENVYNSKRDQFKYPIKFNEQYHHIECFIGKNFEEWIFAYNLRITSDTDIVRFIKNVEKKYDKNMEEMRTKKRKYENKFTELGFTFTRKKLKLDGYEYTLRKNGQIKAYLVYGPSSGISIYNKNREDTEINIYIPKDTEKDLKKAGII